MEVQQVAAIRLPAATVKRDCCGQQAIIANLYHLPAARSALPEVEANSGWDVCWARKSLVVYLLVGWPNGQLKKSLAG